MTLRDATRIGRADREPQDRGGVPTRVGVIGGGPNGVIVVNELLRQIPEAQVILFGKDSNWGHGLVYGEAELATSRQSFITSEMGVDAHDAEALLHWVLERRDELGEDYEAEDLGPDSFPARHLIGRYFEDRIEVALARAEAIGADLKLIADPVVSVAGSGPFSLRCASGRRREVDHIFLCLGNFPSSYGRELRDVPGYHPEIWGVDFFGEIAVQDDVLVIGSGLSSIDVLFGLNSRGHGGKVLFASRNGLLPTARGACRDEAELSGQMLETIAAHPSLAELEAAATDEVRRLGGESLWDCLEVGRVHGGAEETPQQALVRLLGDQMTSIWAGWTTQERHRFDRLHGALWNALHLPMAPHSTEMLRAELDAGRLVVGRLEALRPQRQGFATRVSGVERHVDEAINATGRNLDVRKIEDPLVSSLLGTGLLRPHELGGFDVDPATSRRGEIFVIGPLTRGVRFYTYVLSENARQAAAAVAELVSESTTLHQAGSRVRFCGQPPPTNRYDHVTQMRPR